MAKREKEENIVHIKEKVFPKPGDKYDIRDFQIAFNSDDGPGFLTCEYESQESSFDPMPGLWNVDRKGRHPFTLDDITIFPTPTLDKILKEARSFINNIEVYKTLDIIPKRGILVGSPPGCGKSTAINAFCKEILNQFPNDEICVFRTTCDSEGDIWPEIISSFASFDPKEEKCEKLKYIVVVIEDIGGTTGESTVHHNLSSDMLNFLDGAPGMFPVPTLIIATTNYLEELQDNVIDRPGRFDSVFQLELPSMPDRIKLLESWMKKLDKEWTMTKDVETALSKFEPTPAHIKEIIVRHKIHNLSLLDAIKQMAEQSKKAKDKNFKKKEKLGFQ